MTSKKASGAATKPAQRVIKKYPNRRLYDTETSTYITLAEVKQLVMDHQPFVVRDAKTNEVLTRSILLQIILEEEAGGAPMFSEAALANIIRFYGHAMQGFMGTYLEKNVQAFTDLQSQMAEQGIGQAGVGDGRTHLLHRGLQVVDQHRDRRERGVHARHQHGHLALRRGGGVPEREQHRAGE